MNTHIFSIEGFSAAVGLDWVFSNGDAKEKAEEKDAKGYVVLKNVGHEIVGLASELPKKGKLYSFAVACQLYLNNKIKNAAFLFETDGQIVFVGILDGLPLSGCDSTVLRNAMHEALDNFIAEVGKQAMVLYTNIPVLGQEYKDIANHADPEEVAALLKDKGNAQIAVIQGASSNVGIILAVAFVMLGAGAVLGWNYWKQKQHEALLSKQVSQQKPPQQIYEEGLPAAYAKAGWELPETLNVIGAIAGRDLKRGGWATEKIICSLPRNGCEASWKPKEPGATFASFSNATAPALRSALTYRQNEIREAIELKAKPITGWRLSELGEKAAVFNRTLSELQRLAATGDAQISYRDPTPYAISGQAAPHPVFQGGFTFTAGMYLLPMLSRVPSNFISVAEVGLDFGEGKPSFRIELNYYVSKP